MEKIDIEPNPWHPTRDRTDLKVLGKLLEELGELTAAVSRCVIQGINEAEPTTGKMNYNWLTEEIADVYANINLTIDRFGLDREFITKRATQKRNQLRKWHDMG